jgi:hypothetical protein
MLIEHCVRHCVDVPGTTVFRQKLSDIEMEILSCVNFELVPVHRDEKGPLHREDEHDVWEYFSPSRFQWGAPTPDSSAAQPPVTKIPYENFSVVVSCERSRQIFHHWNAWRHVEQLEGSLRVLDREFMVKFSDEIECPHLYAVHSRFSALVAEDLVLAITVYRLCWGRHRTVTGILRKDRLQPLVESKAVLTEV